MPGAMWLRAAARGGCGGRALSLHSCISVPVLSFAAKHELWLQQAREYRMLEPLPVGRPRRRARGLRRCRGQAVRPSQASCLEEAPPLVSRRLSMWCCLSPCLRPAAPSLRGAQSCPASEVLRATQPQRCSGPPSLRGAQSCPDSEVLRAAQTQRCSELPSLRGAQLRPASEVLIADQPQRCSGPPSLRGAQSCPDSEVLSAACLLGESLGGSFCNSCRAL